MTKAFAEALAQMEEARAEHDALLKRLAGKRRRDNQGEALLGPEALSALRNAPSLVLPLRSWD